MSILKYGRTLCWATPMCFLWIAAVAVAQEGTVEARQKPREFTFPKGIEDWAVGAGGARLALRDQGTGEIVVIDVAHGELVARSIPHFLGEPCRIAADADAVYLLASVSQKIIALRLQDLSEITRADTDYQGVNAIEIAAGSAARGPLAIYVTPERFGSTDADCDGVQLLDRETLKPHRSESIRWQVGSHSHKLGSASNDGTTFLFAAPNSKLLLWRSGHQWLQQRIAADGSTLLSENGRVLMSDRPQHKSNGGAEQSRGEVPPTAPELRAFPVDEQSSLLTTFGLDSPMHATLETTNDGSALRLRFADSNESLETVGVFDFLDESVLRPDGTSGKGRTERILYSHGARAVVAIPRANQRVVWFRYDLQEAIERASPPTIKILSSALPPAFVGEKWEFQLQALASTGTPKFTLENAPDGMSIDDEGKLTWTPLNPLHDPDVTVNVVASAGEGLKCTRSFPLVVEHAEGPDRPLADLAESAIVTSDTRVSSASPGGEVVLLTSDRRAALLGVDGFRIKSTTPLSADYDLIGKRGTYFVAVNVESRGIDVVHAVSGDVLRSAKIPGAKAIELAMHPTKPVSYLSYSAGSRTSSSSFLIFDEVKGTMTKSSLKWCGERLAFNPDGTRLASARLESTRLEQQVTGFGSPVKNEWERKPFVYLYDTSDPFKPFQLVKTEFESRRDVAKSPAVSWQPDGALLALTGSDRIVLCSRVTLKPSGIQLTAPLGDDEELGEPLVAWHPQFRIAAGFVRGEFVVGATDDKLDKGFPRRMVGTLPEDLEKGRVEHLWFSRDGRNLIFLHQYGVSSRLRVASLWFPEEFEKFLPKPEDLNDPKPPSLVPLKDLQALRGGLGDKLTPRAIAERFASSVAVVESGGSRGTAFVVGSAGYALTCDHVLEQDKPVRLVFLDPKNPTEDSIAVNAEVVGRDAEKDMALLRFEPPHDLTPLRLSRDERCSLGEPTVVIGNPGLGESVLERTVTIGVISSTSRRIGTYPLIQLSAQVNPGSSGGPVFDELGRVIGMVTLKARIEGAGFAAPAPELTRFLMRNASFDGDSIQLEREWGEQGSNRAVTARLLSFDDETVHIATESGKEYRLPRTRLHEGDVLFLSDLASIRIESAAIAAP